MANKSLKQLWNENRPGIYTFITMVTCAATAIVGVYEGVQLYKDWQGIGGSDAPTKEKVKVVARRVAPVVVGVAVADGFAFGAYKDAAGKIAAGAVAVAALKTDKEDLENWKAKASEMLGEEKSKEITDKVREERKGTNIEELNLLPEPLRLKYVWFKDQETGYMFRSSLNEFYRGVKQFNDNCEYENGSINDFYNDIIDGGSDYSMHDYVVFGPDCDMKFFNPILERVPMDNMSEDMYVFRYRFSVDPHPAPRKLNEDDGYNAVKDRLISGAHAMVGGPDKVY